MLAAQEKAVDRLDEIPYSESTISYYIAPKASEWVFNEDYETKIRKFLEKDAPSRQVENNFVMKPNGVVWERICNMYNLEKDRAVSAFHVNSYAVDPNTFTHMHYGFAT